MRHRVAHRKLGRVTEHRIAMLRNQATALLRHEHLVTTVPRAKELVKGMLSASALPLGTIIRVATREPALALTFDDGPHPEDTPPLLELLERHGAKATFFMVGKSARRWPDLVTGATWPSRSGGTEGSPW